MFYSVSFMVLAFKFRSLIHFKLIFVPRMRLGLKLISY